MMFYDYSRIFMNGCETVTNDTIIVQGLEVFAHHGVLAEEKRDGQMFYLDLELSVELSAASQSDDLNDTINYNEVCRIAGEAMTANTYDLIERAAGVVCESLFTFFPSLEKIAITLRKPSAPLCRKVEYVAVKLVRERQQYEYQ